MASRKACSNLRAAGRDWRLTWLVSSTVGKRSKVTEWWAESQHSLDSIFTLVVTSQCHPRRAWLWRRGLADHAGSTCVCLRLPPPESKCAATGAGQERGLGPWRPGRPSFVRQHIPPPPPSGGEPLAHHQKLSELDVPVWRQKSSKGLTLQCLWLWSQLHRLDQSFPGDWDSKESACNAGDLCSTPGSGKSLEREMATHSSMLVWRIPWTEEPGGPQSMGSQRVRQDWATNTLLTDQGTRLVCSYIRKAPLVMSLSFYFRALHTPLDGMSFLCPRSPSGLAPFFMLCPDLKHPDSSFRPKMILPSSSPLQSHFLDVILSQMGWWWWISSHK